MFRAVRVEGGYYRKSGNYYSPDGYLLKGKALTRFFEERKARREKALARGANAYPIRLGVVKTTGPKKTVKKMVPKKTTKKAGPKKTVKKKDVIACVNHVSKLLK